MLYGISSYASFRTGELEIGTGDGYRRQQRSE